VLTVAIQRGPAILNPDLTPGLPGAGQHVHLMLHNTLVVQNDRYAWVPQLAAEQISLPNGTWRLNEDGSMDTIWRLRPGVRWHDGAPFTASDLAFAYAVYMDPAIPIQARGGGPSLMVAATATDALTLAVRWARPYVNADRAEALIPLPRHLLEEAYQRDPAGIQESRYLSTEFVGLGPYRLVSWVEGSHLDLVRFDDYHLGRPPLDRIVVRFIPDPNAMVASILSGSVDVIPAGSVGLDAARAVSQQWDGTGNQVHFAASDSFRRLLLQHRPEYGRPRDGFTNLLVRRAFYHAIDRASLAETVTSGLAPVADSWIPPNHELRPFVEDEIPQFAYEPTRARELLAQAGWARGADGVLRHAETRERFEVELYTAQAPENLLVQPIIGNDWKALGADVSLVVLPPVLWNDLQYRAKTPGVYLLGTPMERVYSLEVHSRNTPSAENAWVGYNLDGYANSRVDRILERLAVTISRGEQIPLHRELLRERAGDVSFMPLYWLVDPVFALASVKGVRGRTPWNVFEWDKAR